MDDDELETGFKLKKYLPIIGIVIAVIVLLFILISIIGGGQIKLLKKLSKGVSKQDVDTILDMIDFTGLQAWYADDIYDTNDFDDGDYDDFIEAYKDVKKSDSKELKSEVRDALKEVLEMADDEYKSVKVKIKKVNSAKKLGKDLYAINAKIEITAKAKDKNIDDIQISATAKIVIYQDKFIGIDPTNYMYLVDAVVDYFI